MYSFLDQKLRPFLKLDELLLRGSTCSVFWPMEGCAKCRAIVSGDNSVPTLGHSAGRRARMEGLLAQDPPLSKRLERAQQRQDEFLVRRVEAGDASSKRSRAEQPEDVVLQPGPGGREDFCLSRGLWQNAGCGTSHLQRRSEIGGFRDSARAVPLLGQGLRQGATDRGFRGAHLNPLAYSLNPLGLFLRTSIPFTWLILSAFLRA